MQRTRPAVIMAEIAIMAALAFILDLLTLLRFWPQGGSISFAMLPIFIMAFRRGWKAGLVTGLIYGFLDLMYDPFIVHWVQAILEYPFAFTVVGLAGIFAIKKEDSRIKKTLLITTGVFVGSLLRFFVHFIAALVWFGEYAPEGTPVPIYAFGYNVTYMAPSFIVCLVAILILGNINKRILHPAR